MRGRKRALYGRHLLAEQRDTRNTGSLANRHSKRDRFTNIGDEVDAAPQPPDTDTFGIAVAARDAGNLARTNAKGDADTRPDVRACLWNPVIVRVLSLIRHYEKTAGLEIEVEHPAR